MRGERAAGITGGLLRIGLAGGLLMICWQDVASVRARAGLDGLPDYDYWKQAEQLLEQDRFSEAMLVVDSGREAFPEQRHHFDDLAKRIEIERASWMHRFQEIGRGALKGTGRSAEALGGAIVADLFVFGDVRDLVIQAGKVAKGGEADKVIVALSAGGILMTVNPALDLGGALLKFARRMGAMTQNFARSFLQVIERSVKKRNADEVLQVTDDMARLSKQASPAGAITIFRSIDSPYDLRLATQFGQRPGGTFALWLGGRSTMALLKETGKGGAEWVLRASRKGPDGLAYLARHGKLMFRPHPLLGFVKGLYKGNIPEAALRFFEEYTLILLGFLSAWLGVEVLGFSAGFVRPRGKAPARRVTATGGPPADTSAQVKKYIEMARKAQKKTGSPPVRGPD